MSSSSIPTDPATDSAAPGAPIVGSSTPERASGLVLLLLIGLAFAVVISRVVQVAGGPPPPASGVVAPAFVAPSLTPGAPPLALESLRGKVVLVDFWATWCPPCVASMPTLEKLHRELGAQGLVVVGVNVEPGDEPTVRAFVRDRGLTLPVVIDQGPIAPSYGVYSYPSSFVVGRDGVVRAAHRGPVSEGRLRAELEAALAEAAPAAQGAPAP